jgi:2-polyprenyl-3-methyl-5-hydroxy-6-metoxy-1,4-benzoquinol methylase
MVAVTEYVKYKNKLDKFSSHSLIVEKIIKLTPSNKNILDIGCFSGELLNRVRIGQKVSNSYFGADLDNYLSKDFNFINFISFDFNDNNLSNLFENKKFDIVILGDILEHLVNPWIALNNIHQIIEDSSKILISIPNSGHWYFRLKIFFGNIEYTNNGLFDKTHLRFFTKKSSKELINDSKLEIVELSYSSLPWENLLKGRLVSKILSIFERFFILLRPQLFAYQFIFLVKPEARDR